MKRMLITSMSLMASLAMAQNAHTTYSVVDLGPLGGAPGTAYFMSGNGLIAGAADTADKQSHATVWFMGFKVDLAIPGLGGLNSLASSVNDKGQVVGAAQSTVANGEDFCGFNAYGVARSSTACLPFLFQNGAMAKLPTLGGPNGMANWINNAGEAVGWAETAEPDPDKSCGVLQFKPVVWGTGSTRMLPTFPGDPDGVAASMNDRGQIVGATGTCSAFNPNSGLNLVEKHAMLWENGMAINLGNLGGSGQNGGHHACAINNRGHVVGHSDLTGDTTFHTFLWTPETGMKDIGTLPGDFASSAISINDSGTVVGGSFDSMFNPRAFVWEAGSMTDLNDLLSSNPQKLYLLLAYSINARGEIVGLSVTGDGNPHGFLATPDRGGNFQPLSNRASSPRLSEEVRRMVLRQTGIRQR